jgi:hypothetical protein
MSSQRRLRVPKRFWHVHQPYAVYQCVGQTVDLKREREWLSSFQEYPMFKLKWKRKVTKI